MTENAVLVTRGLAGMQERERVITDMIEV